MTSSQLFMIALGMPLLAAIVCVILSKHERLRDMLTLIASVGTFAAVVELFRQFQSGQVLSLHLADFGPGLELALLVEPLGMTFALLASFLWIVTHIYGMGYMRGTNEKNQGRFFACFSIAIFSTLGLAFSANLLTLFVFYEVLTISTYPLVAHKQNEEAKAGARTYLAILMGTSIVFLLTAIVWTQVLTGTMDFVQGGILAGKAGDTLTLILLLLFAFGIGKAALMPFHRWLPAAMVAPTPVSALLHAVAVVKAGVFSMLKVGVYIFGLENLSNTGASTWLMWLAAFSIIAASLIAMRQDNLKKRLAYSTVSQLSYITLGVGLATSMGALGGGLHIVTHAFGKITLFMCAGAIYVATHKTEISQMRGLGRKMPITFIAFGIGSLSIIGVPPLAGSWSKWLLMVGAADAGQQIMIGVLMLSSLLNVAYLIPVFANGFFDEHQHGHGKRWRDNISEAPWLCVAPLCLSALGCLALFYYSTDITEFLSPITAGGR